MTLDPVLKDSNGIPAPRIDYTIGENSRRMIAHAMPNARKILEAAGASNIATEVPILNGGWHLLGTARMGDDPKTSVVNRHGQAHDADNLFIVDGSLFVTSGAVNPTPTIQALALWVAEHIATTRTDLKGTAS